MVMRQRRKGSTVLTLRSALFCINNLVEIVDKIIVDRNQ